MESSNDSTIKGNDPKRAMVKAVTFSSLDKDSVVHVRVWWIMETLKHPARTVGWVAQLCCSWLFPREGSLDFPWEKFHWDNTVVKGKVKVK